MQPSTDVAIPCRVLDSKDVYGFLFERDSDTGGHIGYAVSRIVDKDKVPSGQLMVFTRETEGMMRKGQDWRSWVGPVERYDITGANQFRVMVNEGLRESHEMLDIGCGSLRGGRFFILYLGTHGYHGIEPEEWLVKEGIKYETGDGLIQFKLPAFEYAKDFGFGRFGHDFDYLLAQSIFTHTSVVETNLCLSEAVNVMHDKSVFIANFEESSDATRINFDGWKECNQLTYGYFSGLAAKHGLSMKRLDYPHPSGLKWVRMEKV